MKRSPRLLTPTLLFLLLLAIQPTATAQATLSSCTQIRASNDFLALADRRAELLDEIQDTKTEISELEKQLPEAVTVTEFEDMNNRDVREYKIESVRPLLVPKSSHSVYGSLLSTTP